MFNKSVSQFKVRFVPLGGIVGVTKNMYLYEVYEKNNKSFVTNRDSSNYSLKDILIVDCGIGFPKEKELGVDFVIPDITYLLDKVDKIRGIVITHGHEDHTSALPYHYRQLGSPKVYASKLTTHLMKQKSKEHNLPIQIEEIEYGKEYLFGNLSASFIHVTHSIPDTTHILIKSPVGSFYHGSDFKFDLTPPFGKSPDFYAITKAGNDGILCLLSDCLGAEHDGLTLSESTVGQTFEDEMRKTKGKFIMTTFSSNISRIRQCVEASIKFNRKIFFLGRSMKENTRISQEINYLPIPRTLIGKENEISKLPSNRICLIVAGSQGQYGSALSKIANKMNESIKISQGDKVVISSDPIPGNENEVYALIEELSLQGADVIYSDIQDQLHASGHGNREDLKLLIRFTNPKYFIPIGGTIRHQQQYKKLVGQLGHPVENAMMLKEGETVWFEKNNVSYGEKVETKNIFVDAYGVGDVGNMILRDRKTLSSEGIVVALLIIDTVQRLVTKPKLLSKGFIYEKKDNRILEKATSVIEEVTSHTNEQTDLNSTKRKLIEKLEQFFFKETGRRPLVAIEMIQL